MDEKREENTMKENIVSACDLATKWAATFKVAFKIRDSGIPLSGKFQSFSALKAGFSGSPPTLSKLLKSGVDAGLIERDRDASDYRISEKYGSIIRVPSRLGFIYLEQAANMLIRISENADILTTMGDDEMCVGEIAKRAGWAGSKVSVRCARLHASGSLDRNRDDRRVYYSISDSGFRTLERIVKVFQEGLK